MLGLSLVRALEEDWRDTLDAVARRRGWPASQDVPELAARVAALSASYNDPAVARATMRDGGAARLSFAFARDVPKAAAAVRELVVLKAIPEGARLRILDLGAGLGATTWGVVRALESHGLDPEVEATWVEPDRAALELALEVVRQRQSGHVALRIHIHAMERRVSERAVLDDLGRFDLVLVGQLLSELDVGLDDSARLNRHAAILRGLLDRHTAEHGSLVIIEPALRERTRHLHALRDRLVSLGATVFAPCTHAAPCPALARESDWCHEDIPVDLPGWLVPVARAAGLRREGLTFSYLVLRKDGLSLAQLLGTPPPTGRPLRVVSSQMRSKGKREAFVCGDVLTDNDALVAARIRATRLDRDKRPPNADWGELMRGDVIAVEPALQVRGARIGSATKVKRVDASQVARSLERADESH
jgi:hypothetical protein